MQINVRLNWLKGMYLFTIVGAGGFGSGIIFMPDLMRALFGWPSQDPIVFGVAGSVFLAFGIVSVFGLRSPLTFAPILLLQLAYKSIWFVGVVLPLFISNKLPAYAWLYVLIFAAFIIGDLIAIPFSGLLKKYEDRDHTSVTVN